MDAYILLLYVTEEQEDAIKTLFAKNNWLFSKSDTQQLCSPKKTVLQYDDLVNCNPKICTITDSHDSCVYTTHNGGLIGPIEIDVKRQGKEKTVNTTCLLLNTDITESQAGVKSCSVRLSRLPANVERTGRTSTRKKIRGTKHRRLNFQDTISEKSNSPATTTRASSMFLQSNNRKDKEIKIENTSDDIEHIHDAVSDTDGSIAKEVIQSENDTVHGHDADVISDMSENGEDYKPREEGDDDDADDGVEIDETDPDYHYGDRVGAESKKKKSPVKKGVTFPCEQCKKSYKFQRGYLNHLKDGMCKPPIKKKRKKDEKAGTGSYFCEVCKRTYTYKRTYNAHFVEGRCNKQCKYCDKVLSRNVLKRHVFYKHEVEDERFRCKICQKRFFEKRELTAHMHLHDSNRSFVCDFCGKAFYTYGNLYVHRKTHTEKPSDRKAYCNLCNKEFNDKNYLYFHKKVTHLTVRNCMCEICGKKFKTDRCVKNHMTSHSKDRPFHCETCGKYYKYSHQLSAHKKLFHSKLKRFFCKVCGKGFYFEGKLKDHMNIHSGTRAHTCPHCNYSTYTSGQLTQHKRKHRKPKNDIQKIESASVSPEKLPEETTGQKVVVQIVEIDPDSFSYI